MTDGGIGESLMRREGQGQACKEEVGEQLKVSCGYEVLLSPIVFFPDTSNQSKNFTASLFFFIYFKDFDTMKVFIGKVL